MELSPLIVDIKRHSLEDGPGIRTVVFFKGCPLRCVHCHNPETQDARVEIAFEPSDCIRCGKCAEVCPEGAIDLASPERILRRQCTRCGLCAEECPGSSLSLIGVHYPVDRLADVLFKDLPFYRHSGGGITLSGGECTLYPDYLNALLKVLKEQGIHVVLQTSGYFDYPAFIKKVLPYIDVIYFDIKIADPDLHRKYTGRSNDRILRNLRALVREPSVEIHPRVPLVPGITTTRENLSGIVEVLVDAGADDVSLIPYNPMGLEMNRRLGRSLPPVPSKFMKPEEEEEIHIQFKALVHQHLRQSSGGLGMEGKR